MGNEAPIDSCCLRCWSVRAGVRAGRRRQAQVVPFAKSSLLDLPSQAYVMPNTSFLTFVLWHFSFVKATEGNLGSEWQEGIDVRQKYGSISHLFTGLL